MERMEAGSGLSGCRVLCCVQTVNLPVKLLGPLVQDRPSSTGSIAARRFTPLPRCPVSFSPRTAAAQATAGGSVPAGPTVASAMAGLHAGVAGLNVASMGAPHYTPAGRGYGEDTDSQQVRTVADVEAMQPLTSGPSPPATHRLQRIICRAFLESVAGHKRGRARQVRSHANFGGGDFGITQKGCGGEQRWVCSAGVLLLLKVGETHGRRRGFELAPLAS